MAVVTRVTARSYGRIALFPVPMAGDTYPPRACRRVLGTARAGALAYRVATHNLHVGYDPLRDHHYHRQRVVAANSRRVVSQP
jgi:hypothetical protein